MGPNADSKEDNVFWPSVTTTEPCLIIYTWMEELFTYIKSGIDRLQVHLFWKITYKILVHGYFFLRSVSVSKASKL